VNDKRHPGNGRNRLPRDVVRRGADPARKDQQIDFRKIHAQVADHGRDVVRENDAKDHFRTPFVEKGEHVGDVAFPRLGLEHLVAENHDADFLRHSLSCMVFPENRIIVLNAGGKIIDIEMGESVTWECNLRPFEGKNREKNGYLRLRRREYR
jgi:hypothetical protein